jgi:myo-inositol-1-phosphate synthase
MKANHPAIAPSMLYAWAAITSGVPFANGAPNLTVDIPATLVYCKEKFGFALTSVRVGGREPMALDGCNRLTCCHGLGARKD